MRNITRLDASPKNTPTPADWEQAARHKICRAMGLNGNPQKTSKTGCWEQIVSRRHKISRPTGLNGIPEKTPTTALQRAPRTAETHAAEGIERQRDSEAENTSQRMH